MRLPGGMGLSLNSIQESSFVWLRTEGGEGRHRSKRDRTHLCDERARNHACGSQLWLNRIQENAPFRMLLQAGRSADTLLPPRDCLSVQAAALRPRCPDQRRGVGMTQCG